AGVRKIGFDYLVVATGMRPSYFGHDEFARYAPGLKSLTDAETIRAKILGAFELAATTEDEGERARQMTFVLVGAGATGVELAGSLADLVKVTLRGNFRRIDPSKSAIILLDAGNRVLPTFAEAVSRKVARRLTKLGVKVMTGVKVETVDDQGVVAGGSRIPSATVLWTAGGAASPIPKMLGTKTDRAGRALVDPFLKVVDTPGVFVAGDAASVMQNRHPVPGVAQAAIQEGRYVGRLIASELKGREVKRPFHYFDKGNMAVVAKNYAVLERGWLCTGGFLTWLVWAFVHILSLPQLQNRLRVQRQWLWSYFTCQRSSRLIPASIYLLPRLPRRPASPSSRLPCSPRLRWSVLGPAILLTSCPPAGVLDPQGPIASAERLLLINSTAIMLVVVIPVIVATLAFAWWYRASNTRATRSLDESYEGRVEFVTWSIPALTVILLGGVIWI